MGGCDVTESEWLACDDPKQMAVALARMIPLQARRPRLRKYLAAVDSPTNRLYSPRMRAEVLRDIIGNPFRPVSIRKVVTAARGMSAAALESGATEEVVWQSPWLTPQVLALADAAYHERLPDGTLDPLRLSVLADALEEAGCDNAEILTHLRSPGPHWRGCWAVDLLLRKE